MEVSPRTGGTVKTFLAEKRGIPPASFGKDGAVGEVDLFHVPTFKKALQFTLTRKLHYNPFFLSEHVCIFELEAFHFVIHPFVHRWSLLTSSPNRHTFPSVDTLTIFQLSRCFLRCVWLGRTKTLIDPPSCLTAHIRHNIRHIPPVAKHKNDTVCRHVVPKQVVHAHHPPTRPKVWLRIPLSVQLAACESVSFNGPSSGATSARQRAPAVTEKCIMSFLVYTKYTRSNSSNVGLDCDIVAHYRHHCLQSPVGQ